MYLPIHGNNYKVEIKKGRGHHHKFREFRYPGKYCSISESIVGSVTSRLPLLGPQLMDPLLYSTASPVYSLEDTENIFAGRTRTHYISSLHLGRHSPGPALSIFSGLTATKAPRPQRSGSRMRIGFSSSSPASC
jgi:hypothetical protein